MVSLPKGARMSDSRGETPDYRSGDKVRIRAGPRAGCRGRIHAVTSIEIEVELDDGTYSSVQPAEITNYSLAARRAWQVMPKRAGRPRLQESKRKKMVSLRLDAAVWEQLGRAVELGWIPSREEAINSWVQASVQAMFEQGRSGSVPASEGTKLQATEETGRG